MILINKEQEGGDWLPLPHPTNTYHSRWAAAELIHPVGQIIQLELELGIDPFSLKNTK